MADSERKEGFSPFIGLAIAIIGLILLLRNLDVIRIGHRWWALFFLIPIAYLLSDVVRRRENRRSMVGLVTLVALMVIILLGVSWSIMWPIIIIIGGLSLLLARA